jgi:hypothetical protein
LRLAGLLVPPLLLLCTAAAPHTQDYPRRLLSHRWWGESPDQVRSIIEARHATVC